jgi:hypothetical protein
VPATDLDLPPASNPSADQPTEQSQEATRDILDSEGTTAQRLDQIRASLAQERATEPLKPTRPHGRFDGLSSEGDVVPP